MLLPLETVNLRKITIAAITFVVYFLLFQFGSLFTIPYGYSSPIWPLSGIILGLYFCYGRVVLISALFASLLCYYLASAENIAPVYFISFSVISILQLVISKQLVIRFCPFPIKSHNAIEIIKFLVLTGPVSVFITTILAIVLIAHITSFNIEALAYIAAAKWAGDFIGIVFLTPIMLFVIPNKFVRKGKKPLASIMTTLTVLVTINIIFLQSSNNVYHEKERQFNDATQPFIENLSVLEATIKQNLSALDGLMQVKSDLSKAEFALFASKIHTNELNARAIAWLPLVKHEDRAAFELKLSLILGKQAHIKQLTQQGITIAQHADYYIPIYYTEPYEQNKQAIGLDVASHPKIKASINKTIETQQPVLSPLLSLAQQSNKFTGVIAYYPVFKVNPITDKSDFHGLVEVVFELDLLLEKSFKQAGSNAFSYQLTYDKHNTITAPTFNENAYFKQTIPINIFDKQGELKLASTTVFDNQLTNWSGILIIIFCCIIGVICVMFVFFIITFNASLTKKVEQNTAELTAKNTALTQANQAKNLFLANISHEYRTPLNAIIGFTEIAQREIKDSKAREYFQQINESSNILLGIVNDVLDTSKIQAGELSLENRPFCPADATLLVIDMLKDEAEKKGLRITTNLTPEFQQWVSGDITRFKQILINLVNNAIKFTAEGTISIDGHTTTTEQRNSILTISVKDSGIGIPTEALSRLFDPFAQAESSTTRKYGGTGLGLSIVKQLCLLMNGDINVTSQQGQGSEFKVSINLPAAENAIKEESTINTIGYSTLNILIVEDNKINQKVAQKQLDSLGINSDVADDGYQALVYLETNKPDLILMDLQMPNIDGFTASGLIKSNPELQNIPIVILSASVGLEEKEKAAELGISDFINKPFQQANLISVLDKYFPQA